MTGLTLADAVAEFLPAALRVALLAAVGLCAFAATRKGVTRG